MKDYSNYSKFEINKAVAKKEGLDVKTEAAIEKTESVLVGCGVGDRWVNFCRDWSDAGQIIIENDINIKWPDVGRSGEATKYINGKLISHSKFEDKSEALLAAAIVYLRC